MSMTASTYPGGRAAFRAHLINDWDAIVADTVKALDEDRAHPDYALKQWLAFEADYYARRDEV